MKLQLWIVAACGLMVAAGQAAEKEKAKSDKDALQGTWTLVSGTKDGKDMSADEVKGISVTFKGDMLTLKHKDDTTDHKMKMNSDKSPKEMDVDFDGKAGKAIYQLDGDTLKVAHGELGGDRPKDFKGGAGISTMVFKRDKK